MGNYKNGLETKNLIYSSAKKLFIRKGFAETTLRDIAENVGVKLGLINYYFESKDSLGCAIHKELTEQINLAAEKTFNLTHEITAEQALSYHILSYMVYFEFYRQVPEAARLYCTLCGTKEFPKTLIQELAFYTRSVTNLKNQNLWQEQLSEPSYFDVLHSLLCGMEIQLMKDLILGDLKQPFCLAIDIYLELYFQHIFKDIQIIPDLIKATRKSISSLYCGFDEHENVVIKLK